jgi:hypothetical protein
MTRSEEITAVSVWIDPERPLLHVTRGPDDDTLVLEGEDLGTPAEQLTFWARWRTAGASGSLRSPW